MILLTHERQWRGGETVVAFGMFDGVHEGHAQLMRKANELAALHDLKSVVYTFSSHPMATYAPEKDAAAAGDTLGKNSLDRSTRNRRGGAPSV
ncbi:MAG: hypothetical protein ACLUHE_04285 [Christensenellales bacterium]